jgi:hypothetical protein
MDTSTIILKTDSRGRVLTPPERRAALLAEFERSGLPATKFSALVGVRYQTFATWVQQQRRRVAAVEGKQDTKPGAVRLMEVSVERSAAAKALRILLPGGAAIEVADAAQAALAAQLIKALA